MAENIDEELDEQENVSQESVKPADATGHAKRVIGKPITKETARQYQLSSTRSKRLRREARQKMLEALTTELDLGEELKKAMKARDESYLKMIVTAVQLVGCHYDQSDEGKEQRFNVKADTTLKGKMDNKLEVVITETEPKTK